MFFHFVDSSSQSRLALCEHSCFQCGVDVKGRGCEFAGPVWPTYGVGEHGGGADQYDISESLQLTSFFMLVGAWCVRVLVCVRVSLSSMCACWRKTGTRNTIRRDDMHSATLIGEATRNSEGVMFINKYREVALLRRFRSQRRANF